MIDVNESGNVYLAEFAQKLRQDVALIAGESEWTMENLVGFVDRQFDHPDIPFAQSMAFIRHAISALLEKRKMSLPELVRHRVRLTQAVARRIEEHRREMRRQGLQGILSGMDSSPRLETSPDCALEMRERDYAPNWCCENSDIFDQHVFPGRVGELKETGEEFKCACYLDRMEKTDVWLRNLERRRATSFWIPTSTDLFYPDFIVRLTDGRILVVEYKGEHLWADAEEKRQLGALWAEHSNGKCIFVMVSKDIGEGLQEIDAAISGKGR